MFSRETLLKQALDGKKIDIISDEDGEESLWDHSKATVGAWWRKKPPKKIEIVILEPKEEEIDLDLSLNLDDDDELQQMEVKTAVRYN